MLPRAATFLGIVVLATTGAAWVTVPTYDSARAWAHLKTMVELGPRPSGSEALRQTRAYITRQISSMGLTLNGPVDMSNLVVTLAGTRPDRILFGGHYDTKLFKAFPFVGASDGGSSAAFLIELVRALKDEPREFTYEFIWFDGEESVVAWDLDGDATYGSRFYVQQARDAGALSQIKALVLVDMIGSSTLRLERDSYSADWLNDIIWSTARRLGHAEQFPDVETTIEDDHLHFVRAGIPSVDLIDLNNYNALGHWHTASDTLAHVSAASLQVVGDVLLASLPEIVSHLTR
jgi:glutaminyl-peptide cyclotransferase